MHPVSQGADHPGVAVLRLWVWLVCQRWPPLLGGRSASDPRWVRCGCLPWRLRAGRLARA